MLLVRIARKGRWQGSDSSAETAAKDLSLRSGESGLSVYRVAGIDEAVDIVKIHAPTAWRKVAKIDFLLFEEDIISEVEGLKLKQVDSHLHPDVSCAHHEILGLTIDKSQLLAEAILRSNFDVKRISENDLVESVKERIEVDEKFKDYIYEDWYAQATSQRLA